jgi:sodium-dependent dicarboxylate transporter 2/3/5
MDREQFEGPYSLRQKIGLVLGLVIFFIGIFLPPVGGLSLAAQRVAIVALVMAIWWVSEAISLYVTALLPLVLFPLLNVVPIKDVAASYAEPTIFLFMGGFFLADGHAAMGSAPSHIFAYHQDRWSKPAAAPAGVHGGDSVYLHVVSNTATTMMIFPIGLALISKLDPAALVRKHQRQSSFGTILMLSIAYAASIGGVGTITGTPPNAIFVGQAKLLFPELGEVGFLQWMLVGVPFVIIFLGIAWAYLAFICMRNPTIADPAEVYREVHQLEPMSREEKGVLAIFALAVLGWVFRADMQLGSLKIPGWATLAGLSESVGDATVALGASLLLFVIPTDFKAGRFLLTWEWAGRIPWGVLLIFGGGFALAQGIQQTGLAAWAAEGLVRFAQMPLLLLVFVEALSLGLLSG